METDIGKIRFPFIELFTL